MKKTLDANKLKLIAIIAMTLDHIAWLLFPGYSDGALPVVMHIIGRLTCPIMCYFIAEGYYHTRNIRKYTFRLFLFAVISHFAYIFASNDFVDARSFIPFYFGSILNQTSVMWPLAWGLVMLRVANSERFTQLQKTLLVILICLVSFPSDWSCIASLCVLAFGTNRGDLFFTVHVEVPKHLGEKQKELLRQFEDSLNGREYERRKSFGDQVKSYIRDNAERFKEKFEKK